MLQLEESWIYQRGHKVGLDEGHKVGLDEGHKVGLDEGRNDVIRLVQDQAIGMVRARFGEDLQDRIRRIKDPAQLAGLIQRLATAGTLAEAMTDLPVC